MAESSAAAVYHHADLTLALDAHLVCCVFVVDLVNHLNLSVVVSSSERSQLRKGAKL